MKYNLKAPPSKTEQNLSFDIPDNPPTITPVITGTTPIDPPPTGNQPPTVNAGDNFEITLPKNTVKLSGAGSDPEGNAVSFLWSKVSGGAASIMSPNSAVTDVADLVKGDYVFRLTVTDDKGVKTTDDVTGTVKPEIIVVPPTPGKYEGFGIAAASAANQSNIVLIDTPAKFEANLFKSNIILRFTKAMTIVGNYTLNNAANFMIDANGFDVVLDARGNDNGLAFEGSGNHHFIVQGLRTINTPKGADGMNATDGAHDFIFANCSVYDCGDGGLDCAGAVRGTIQDCILGKGKPGWGGPMLITAINVSVFRNLFNPATANAEGERCPFVHASYDPGVGNPNADIRNNVIMNFGRSGGTGSGYGTAIAYNAKANVVNNFYFDKESASNAISSSDGYGNGNNGKVFSSGNHITNGTNILSATMANNSSEFPIPTANKITMLTALEAKAKVKASVGTAVKNSYEQGLINAIP